jgi:hypothetical protein
VRALIDKSVPSALTYYSTYLAEPSPAGDITLKKDEMTTVDHLDLKQVLTEMKGVGSGGELLVITHSSPTGFLMKVWPGAGSSLLFSLMDKILETAEGVRRREAIKSLPSNQVSEAWRRWFIDPGIKLDSDYATNPDWQSFVERQYGRWYEERGRVVLKLRNGGSDLTDLLDLLDAVRKLGLSRLEFRACQIGADHDQMKKVADFFQVKTVVGPKNVQTFYGSLAFSHIKFIPDAKKRATALKTLGGRTLTASLGILMLPHGVMVVAEDRDAIKAFVTQYINAGFSDPAATSLVLGGVNSVGSGPVAFTFPLEADYKKLLDQV